MKLNIILIALLTLALFVSGCTTSVNTGSGSNLPDQSQNNNQEENQEDVQEENNEEENPPSPPSEVRTIEMTAKQWEFIPNTVTVSKGETVRFKVTSIDVSHGMSIPAFGVNERLEPDQIVEFEFTPDKTGEFPFVCSVFCGSGHGGMRGTLIVE